MRIALIPLLYDEYNYGGVLQFYALQKSLINLGHKCEILKISEDTKVCEDSQKLKCNPLKLYLAKQLYKYRRIRNIRNINYAIHDRKVEIDEFKEKYYVKTVIAENININIYDSIICGSDQIWNPDFARKRAFLTFVPDNMNKIIYAASIGHESLNEDAQKAYKPLIERIQHISVREYSAKKILDDFIERTDIQVTADPTLLLTPEEWNEIVIERSEIKNKKYILTYMLGEYKWKKSFIDSFAKENECVIVNIPFASGERFDTENYGDIRIIDASPNEFIGLVKDAEYVFTDSFHACVFSVLFKREFYVFERDGGSSMIGRILTLQENFALDNRIIPSNQKIEKLLPLNYNHNSYYQDSLRAKSINFLINSLNNA